MFTITDARRLAQQAHAGQVDKQGRDYFCAHLVPITRACLAVSEELGVIGVLHDVIEDTAVTAQALISDFGATPALVAAVVSVTRVPGEPYDALVLRAAEHPSGRLVEIADNRWNYANNVFLAEINPSQAAGLRRRYERAYRTLIAHCSADDLANVAKIEQAIQQQIGGL